MTGRLSGKERELVFGAALVGSFSTSTLSSTFLPRTSLGLDDSTSFLLLNIITLHCSLGLWPTFISRDLMEALILVKWVLMMSSRASSLLNLPLVSTIKVLRSFSTDGFFSAIV